MRMLALTISQITVCPYDTIRIHEKLQFADLVSLILALLGFDIHIVSDIDASQVQS